MRLMNSIGGVGVRRRGSRLFRLGGCRSGGLPCSCVGGAWRRTILLALSGGEPYVCIGQSIFFAEVVSWKVGEGGQALASGVLARLHGAVQAGDRHAHAE